MTPAGTFPAGLVVRIALLPQADWVAALQREMNLGEWDDVPYRVSASIGGVKDGIPAVHRLDSIRPSAHPPRGKRTVLSCQLVPDY